MNPLVYVIGFIIGYVLGSRINGAYPGLVLTVGLFIAFGLGNYPYYPLPVVATTYLASLLGVFFGGVAKK